MRLPTSPRPVARAHQTACAGEPGHSPTVAAATTPFAPAVTMPAMTGEIVPGPRTCRTTPRRGASRGREPANIGGAKTRERGANAEKTFDEDMNELARFIKGELA